MRIHDILTMRTTIYLDNHLLAQAKKAAAEKGTTLTGLIEDSLRAALLRREAAKQPLKAQIACVPGKRVATWSGSGRLR